jgi:V/A-type H+-transporting ATPase subunit I
MFTPLPMQYVTVYLIREEGPAAALALAECGVFSPEYEEWSHNDQLPEHPGASYRELFQKAQRRLDKILSHLHLESILTAPVEPVQPISESELEELNTVLGEIWRECSWCEEAERRMHEDEREVAQLSNLLDKYEALDINLDLLHGKLKFLDVHVGSVRSGDLKRLSQAVGLVGYTLTVFLESDDTAYVAFAGLQGAEEELQNVLDAASFRPLELPAEFRGQPSKLRARLASRQQDISATSKELLRRVEHGKETHGDTLRRAVKTLKQAAPYAALADTLHSRRGLARVNGWVPKDRVAALGGALTARLKRAVVLETRDPKDEERPRVPSAIRYSRWMRPFAALVRNYGVPRYGELDPTWLFAITFVAMFGMMFGDIGHGLLIALAGAAFWRRLRGFSPFVVAVGASSTLFGLLYGSVFGFEELVDPVWISPLSDPMRMLTVALFWGIGFVLLATAITVRNRLAEGRVRDALMDGKGLAGMVFYLGVLLAAYRWAGRGALGWLETVAVVVPLAVILGYKWYGFSAPVGERILVVFMEGFETLMSYVANTLSFLRVAAFSLNHVALAVAVFALAEMMGATGHFITVILGNVFILVLEGAIVAIQVLRLEYYEGFSRFFSGDGREFRPITLDTVNGMMSQPK